MNKILSRSSLLLMVVIALGSGCAHKPAPAPQAALPVVEEQQEEGAKVIFFTGWGPQIQVPTPSSTPGGKPEAKIRKRRPDKPKIANKQEYLGIRYAILLIGSDGSRREVNPTRTFKSGERIKLQMQSNRDGYLYLINRGSTGWSNLLFPHPALAGNSNFIKAHMAYEIPYNAYIRFDENPGEEIILLMFSPNPMEELLVQYLPAKGSQAMGKEETDQIRQVAQEKRTKDLILEVDSVASQPALYAVAPYASLVVGDKKMITLEINLRHSR